MYRAAQALDNNEKILEGRGRDLFAFNALVSRAGRKIAELFGPAAGPVDHYAINTIMLSASESHGQLRLR